MDTIIFYKQYFGHLGVVVNIDHIHGPVSVTDEEDGVVIWLQHLQKVDIGSAVQKNKIPKLRQKNKRIIIQTNIRLIVVI